MTSVQYGGAERSSPIDHSLHIRMTEAEIYSLNGTPAKVSHRSAGCVVPHTYAASNSTADVEQAAGHKAGGNGLN